MKKILTVLFSTLLLFVLSSNVFAEENYSDFELSAKITERNGNIVVQVGEDIASKAPTAKINTEFKVGEVTYNGNHIESVTNDGVVEFVVDKVGEYIVSKYQLPISDLTVYQNITTKDLHIYSNNEEVLEYLSRGNNPLSLVTEDGIRYGFGLYKEDVNVVGSKYTIEYDETYEINYICINAHDLYLNNIPSGKTTIEYGYQNESGEWSSYSTIINNLDACKEIPEDLNIELSADGDLIITAGKEDFIDGLVKIYEYNENDYNDTIHFYDIDSNDTSSYISVGHTINKKDYDGRITLFNKIEKVNACTAILKNENQFKLYGGAIVNGNHYVKLKSYGYVESEMYPLEFKNNYHVVPSDISYEYDDNNKLIVKTDDQEWLNRVEYLAVYDRENEFYYINTIVEKEINDGNVTFQLSKNYIEENHSYDFIVFLAGSRHRTNDRYEISKCNYLIEDQSFDNLIEKAPNFNIKSENGKLYIESDNQEWLKSFLSNEGTNYIEFKLNANIRKDKIVIKNTSSETKITGGNGYICIDGDVLNDAGIVRNYGYDINLISSGYESASNWYYFNELGIYRKKISDFDVIESEDGSIVITSSDSTFLKNIEQIQLTNERIIKKEYESRKVYFDGTTVQNGSLILPDGNLLENGYAYIIINSLGYEQVGIELEIKHSNIKDCPEFSIEFDSNDDMLIKSNDVDFINGLLCNSYENEATLIGRPSNLTETIKKFRNCMNISYFSRSNYIDGDGYNNIFFEKVDDNTVKVVNMSYSYNGNVLSGVEYNLILISKGYKQSDIFKATFRNARINPPADTKITLSGKKLYISSNDSDYLNSINSLYICEENYRNVYYYYRYERSENTFVVEEANHRIVVDLSRIDLNNGIYYLGIQNNAECAYVELELPINKNYYYIDYYDELNSYNYNPIIYINNGSKITLDPPYNIYAGIDYIFGGWYLDSSFKTKITAIDTKTMKNYELYAKWNPINHRIIYSLNGGKNSPNNKNTYNVNDKFELSDPTKVGYEFIGWYDQDENKVISLENYYYDLTLTAKWQPITYTVSFNKGSEEATGTMTSQTFTYDETKALNSNAFSRVGYEFNGWKYTNDSGKVVSVKNSASIKNITIANGREIEFVAQWKLGKITTSDGIIPVQTRLNTAVYKWQGVQIPLGLGVPKLSIQEIDELIASDDYDYVADKIETLADAVAYFKRAHFTEGHNDNDPGKDVIAARQGQCSAMTNGLHYLLAGDYDEYGFIHILYEKGTWFNGHIMCYIKENGMYYLINPADYIWNGTWYEPTWIIQYKNQVASSSSLEEVINSLINSNYPMIPNEPIYGIATVVVPDNEDFHPYWNQDYQTGLVVFAYPRGNVAKSWKGPEVWVLEDWLNRNN